jgi:hypothetical protein
MIVSPPRAVHSGRVRERIPPPTNGALNGTAMPHTKQVLFERECLELVPWMEKRRRLVSASLYVETVFGSCSNASSTDGNDFEDVIAIALLNRHNPSQGRCIRGMVKCPYPWMVL